MKLQFAEFGHDIHGHEWIRDYGYGRRCGIEVERPSHGSQRVLIIIKNLRNCLSCYIYMIYLLNKPTRCFNKENTSNIFHNDLSVIFRCIPLDAYDELQIN